MLTDGIEQILFCTLLAPSVATAQCSPSHLAQTHPHLGIPLHPGFSNVLVLHQDNYQGNYQGAGSCILLLAAPQWLPCTARTIAVGRRTAPDYKLQRCPCAHAHRCSGNLVHVHTHTHTVAGSMVTQAVQLCCPHLSLPVPLS